MRLAIAGGYCAARVLANAEVVGPGPWSWDICLPLPPTQPPPQQLPCLYSQPSSSHLPPSPHPFKLPQPLLHVPVPFPQEVERHQWQGHVWKEPKYHIFLVNGRERRYRKHPDSRQRFHNGGKWVEVPLKTKKKSTTRPPF